MDVQRLDKFISSQINGTSRKDARDLVRRGSVAVNGATVRDPEFKIDPDCDSVAVDGSPVGYKKFIYIMLDKPEGVVCATRDGLSETVLELLPPELRRRGLFPAGRLDKDTTGFVLITDDGALAHRILSPKNHVKKTYRVTLEHDISDSYESAFQEGIEIDGEKCLPASFLKLAPRECELIIFEGKYHQVKRMFQALGNHVVKLRRIAIGGLPLDPNLLTGNARELTESELLRLIKYD